VASVSEQSAAAVPGRSFPHAWLALAGEFWQASRPRIVGLVLFTMTISALVAAPKIPTWAVLVNSLVGAGLVIVGAIAFNQRLERHSDAKMPRTARRPVPAGRLTERQITVFGVVTTFAGLAYLAALVNPTIVLLAAVSWVIYVWIYTPAKLFTGWQTAIGAVAGAMPVLLGSAAAGDTWTPVALALFGVVYLWQFPHAMAIAWLYRNEFALAEVRLPTVTDPSGRRAGLLSLAGAAALVPASLIPSVWGEAGWLYGLIAVALGLVYLRSAVRFLALRDDRTARGMLRASIIYLPVLLLVLLAASL
jgi:protoheme IX farnesyltransferase